MADLTQPGPEDADPRGHESESIESTVHGMLAAMADRLATRQPTATFTEVARIAVIQATTMDPVLSRVLRDRTPAITSLISRGAYATQLRTLIGGTSTAPTPVPVPAPEPASDTPYDALYSPDDSVTPDVYSVDNALLLARTSLERCAGRNIHSYGHMATAASELDFTLRLLVAALDAERGDQQ